ncbi:MAG: tRNA (adenosine(37)-N6)-dimethylallyltransferase MiaA [Clostridia bacterium]|nr:tRNA (adenosine(37)-N6)-dimethylallyltransferase MiaA [Clostridia bacterium]
MKPKILCIVGPTASGKSGLALALAGRLGGEIVSCDSMQVYRGMDIGTAKATAAERAAVPHHLLDLIDPDEPFSAADFVSAARAAIADITARGRLPVLCGGTGLYLDSLLRPTAYASPPPDPAVRAALAAELAEQGAEAMHARLAALDPEAAAGIHPNNTKRVLRAIEICLGAGTTKSALDAASVVGDCPYDACVIGLRWPRELLNARIDTRVDAMLAEGLVEETARLDAAGYLAPGTTAGQAIGYKEILPFLRGEESLSASAERLKIATHRYAKRQMTWFGAKDYVEWIDCAGRNFEEIVNIAAERLSAGAECGTIKQ